MRGSSLTQQLRALARARARARADPDRAGGDRDRDGLARDGDRRADLAAGATLTRVTVRSRWLATHTRAAPDGQARRALGMATRSRRRPVPASTIRSAALQEPRRPHVAVRDDDRVGPRPGGHRRSTSTSAAAGFGARRRRRRAVVVAAAARQHGGERRRRRRAARRAPRASSGHRRRARGAAPRGATAVARRRRPGARDRLGAGLRRLAGAAAPRATRRSGSSGTASPAGRQRSPAEVAGRRVALGRVLGQRAADHRVEGPRRSAAASALRWLHSIASSVSASNGGRPVAMACSRQPSA